MMNSILCVEDSEDSILILQSTLKDFNVVFAKTLAEAKVILSAEKFSLIILDLELPDGNGLEVLSSLNDFIQNASVIVVTGKNDFSYKVSAFSLGADDFMLKPYDPRELKLRVESKIRKMAQKSQDEHSLRMGDIICNIQEQRIYFSYGKKLADITSIEMRIFRLFCQNPQKVFSRDEILEKVWGPSVAISDRAVDVHISNLRKKLSSSNVNVEAIVGEGYRIKVLEHKSVPLHTQL